MKKILIAFIALFSITSLASAATNGSNTAIAKVFRAIVKNDFNQAWAQRQKITSQSGTDAQVLLDLSDALILARPENTGNKVSEPRDPWHAMTLVRNIYVRGEGIEAANEFIASEGIELSIDVIEKIIEKQLIEDTFNHATESEYRGRLAVVDIAPPGNARPGARQ